MVNNNNNSYNRSTYSSTTFLTIVTVISIIGIVIYLYNFYKKSIPTPTGTFAGAICPDYWDSIGNGKCQNTNAIGSCSKDPNANIMDFGTDIFTNVNTGNYSKCKWAHGCGVSWSNIDRLC